MMGMWIQGEGSGAWACGSGRGVPYEPKVSAVCFCVQAEHRARWDPATGAHLVCSFGRGLPGPCESQQSETS